MNAVDPAHPGILVQHAEPIFAAGLCASLTGIAGLPVLRAPARPEQVRVLVCDVEGSLQATRAHPGTGVVVVARKPRDFEIQEAMARGVLGYVVASCSLDELRDAVRSAVLGRRFLCQAAARELANGLTNESLTTREHDVLQLLAQGACNKTIAGRLDIALGTVKAHVRAIMGKLKASSRTEAASIAAARGLLREPLACDAHEPGAAGRAGAAGRMPADSLAWA